MQAIGEAAAKSRADQRVGGEMMRLSPIENGGGDVWRQEGELEDARNIVGYGWKTGQD
jgi:hypothetical protein